MVDITTIDITLGTLQVIDVVLDKTIQTIEITLSGNQEVKDGDTD
jgi:hypothetical protein